MGRTDARSDREHTHDNMEITRLAEIEILLPRIRDPACAVEGARACAAVVSTSQLGKRLWTAARAYIPSPSAAALAHSDCADHSRTRALFPAAAHCAVLPIRILPPPRDELHDHHAARRRLILRSALRGCVRASVLVARPRRSVGATRCGCTAVERRCICNRAASTTPGDSRMDHDVA